MIFVTSDHHFGHYKILEYQKDTRPFCTIDDMDNFYIDSWNSQVSDKDTVYHLGDFCFKNAKFYFSRLRGIIKVIPGNHDRWAKKKKEKLFSASNREIEILQPVCVLKVDKVNKFVLCHYPMYSWPHSNYGVLHFHGHTHRKIGYNENAIHVGIDEHQKLLSLRDFMKGLSWKK
jgi:calcineurin-like phosphoesterase family protein